MECMLSRGKYWWTGWDHGIMQENVIMRGPDGVKKGIAQWQGEQTGANMGKEGNLFSLFFFLSLFVFHIFTVAMLCNQDLAPRVISKISL